MISSAWMRWIGGVPVDRKSPRGVVEQMVDRFKQAKQRDQFFWLVVAPEGTRGAIEAWRSGFYHIAHGAGVPIVPAWVDNATMRGGVGPEIPTTGDFITDLRKIADFYRSKMPNHPKLAKLYRMVDNSDS